MTTNCSSQSPDSDPAPLASSGAFFLGKSKGNTEFPCVEPSMEIVKDFEVKELPPYTVACIPHEGPYRGDVELFGRLFGQLMGWAGSQGLAEKAECLSVYYGMEKMEVAMIVSGDTRVAPPIEVKTHPAGRFAVARFELKPSEYEQAWNHLFQDWFPKSGLEMDQRPCYEFYLQNSEDHPEGKHVVEICFGVKDPQS